MKKLVIATRSSKLALWQANHIKAAIEVRSQEQGAPVTVELLPLKTTGDKILDSPLAKIGGKGLFVKEIEEALLDGRADLAVHSMKDVPVEIPEGLRLGVIPEREDPTDTLLSVRYDSLAELPAKAVVGTSSLRRQAQLLALRPDLTIVSLRGNVDTRLRKLLEGEFQAIVMATAGLNRLGLSAPKRQTLRSPEFVPAVGQGALGIEFREDDPELAALLGQFNHPPTAACVTAERAFLTELQGGCQTPIAGHATLTPAGEVQLEGLVADLRGERVVRKTLSGPAERAVALGKELGQAVLSAGGRAILAEMYELAALAEKPEAKGDSL
jgi:hydroxymethylbilane synthase